MSYLDTYFSRVNHLGNTTAERIRNSGIRSFNKWMSESPHTVRNLSIERGLFFDGIILTNKDKEYEKIMFLNVANTIPLLVGDIVNWQLETGEIEKWLIIQEEKKVNGTYRTFWIVRCNYLIKWIDDFGHLQQSWCYFVSSLDSKIKGNYRTWHSLITPQPNKYAEILMPRREISRATNFIVEDESWSLIEYDHSSVPGTIYLSLTENKINRIYDDVVEDIADTDRRADYKIAMPEEIQHFTLNSEIQPIFTIMKNGLPYYPSEIIYNSKNKNIAKVIGNKLMAVGTGNVDISISFPEYTDIEPQSLIIPIIVDNVTTSFSYYIEGPDILHLAESAIYILKDINGNKLTAASVSIDKVELATWKYDFENNYYIITANDKNKLDVKEGLNFTTTVLVDNIENVVVKNIKIVPLW